MNAAAEAPESGFRRHAGWIAGGIVIVAVLAVGAGFWFTYHPW